jgi:hypothetical protein
MQMHYILGCLYLTKTKSQHKIHVWLLKVFWYIKIINILGCLYLTKTEHNHYTYWEYITKWEKCGKINI